MVNMSKNDFRKLMIFHKEISERLENEHMKHVQCLLRRYQDQYVLKFVSCDSPKYKEKVKHLCEYDYCESLILIHESATTLTYSL